MRRPFLTKLLVAAAALALACTSDRNALPTQAPDFDVQAAVTCGDAALANKIKAEIKYLYPNKPSLLNAAQTRFTSVQTKCSQNKIADAQTQAIQLAGFAVSKYQNHQLVSSVTPKDVSDHVNDLYTYVGLPAPGDITGALSSGAAAAVVGPTDPPTDVRTGDQKGGVHIGTGDISATQTVLVTITPDPTGTNLFPNTAGLKEFPPFYDFQTFPDVPLFNRPVLVGICVDLTGVPSDQAHRLQLAHAKRPDKTSLEILARVDAGFLPCNSFVSARSDALMVAQAGRRSFVGKLAERALALFRPQPLHAATLVLPGGLGGLTSNFTDFRAVDPGKLVFRQQPTNTPPGLFITPAVQVTLEKEDGTTITPSTADSVTVAILTGTGTLGATLSGNKMVPLVGGVATFGDLSIDQPGTGYQLTASGTSPTGALPAPATSDAFDITEALLFGSSSNSPRFGDVIEPHPGSLFKINPATGAATFIGSTGINSDRGVPEVSGIAFDPTTGVLYGITGSACSGARLITINTSTGAGTLVGTIVGPGFDATTGPSGCPGGSDALAFSSDGTLYAGGWNGNGSTTGGALLRVDKSNGAVLAVYRTTNGIHLAGLVFDDSGVLWASRGGNGPGQIHTINPADGQTLSTLALKTATGTADNAIVSDLAFGPAGKLYASLPSENQLATIDLTSGVITRIGSFGAEVARMSGLRWSRQ